MDGQVFLSGLIVGRSSGQVIQDELARLQTRNNTQLTQKTRLHRTRGVENQKKEKVLLQAKNQLHSGAQGVLPRHKGADYIRCVKMSWRRRRRNNGTIGLNVYGP
jgi:hypothetical protein